MRRGHRHEALIAAVQTNCHIADASHATDLPLCVYLLQMRELFRWERGLAFGAALDRHAVGHWLAQRERLWERVAARAWVALPIGERQFDARDVEAVNAQLVPLGLIYGAGLASADRPTFFLAHLHEKQRHEHGVLLQVCGRELARGLFAPAAALAGRQTVVLRRESLARVLWEKFEFFNIRRLDGPFKALVETFGVVEETDFVAALPRLVDVLSETLVLHEVGEHRAGQWLEPDWSAMRLALENRRTDLLVRAVRDHLADLEVTLPALVAGNHPAALHFWFANYEGVREQLFPALVQAWRAWRAGDAGSLLLQMAQGGAVHFRALAEQVLRLHRQQGQQAGPAIHRLLSAQTAVCAAPSMRLQARGVEVD